MEPKGSPIQHSKPQWSPQIDSVEEALTRLQKIEELSFSWMYNQSTIKTLKSELECLSKFFSFLKTSQNIILSPELGYFCVLPPEIVIYILSLMDQIHLSVMGSVSKYFNHLANDEYLWQNIAERLFVETECVLPRNKTWKWLVKSRLNLFKDDDQNKTGVGMYIWPCKSLTANKHENRYCGEWSNNQRHGYGVYYWCNGSLYDGDWVFDKREGFGTRTWPNGNKYTGEYKNHKRHGEGEFTFSNGSVFMGTFRDNQFVKGTYTWPNGRVYNGEWNNIFRHGNGSYMWPDGRSYIGGWKNDKRHGLGCYKWQDGDTYEGFFEEGKRVGKGIFKSADGKVYEQIWNEEKFEEFNKGLDSSSVESTLVDPTKPKNKKRERQQLDRGQSDAEVVRNDGEEDAIVESVEEEVAQTPKQKGGASKQQKI